MLLRQRRFTNSILFGFCFLLLISQVRISHAQNMELIAPKEPARKTAPAQLPAPPLQPAAETSEAIVINSLVGLVLLNSPDHVMETSEAAAVRGLRAKEVPLCQQPGFKSVTDRYLGKPLSEKSLGELMRDIILYYRSVDHPVVDVFAPEQDVTDGVLQLVVIEAKVGEKKVEGNRWFSSSSLTNEIRLKSGDYINARTLLSDLDWLNRNPFRAVNLIYSRGEDPGTTDLVLQTQDRFPLRVFTGYENTGNQLTGLDRYLAGFNWGDAFGLGQQVNYQYTTSGDFSSFRAHSGGYIIPLPWRHIVSIYGGYAESSALDSTSLVRLKGRGWQTSGRYTVPLPGSNALVHEAFTGFDFKVSNNNLDFGGSSVYQNSTDIDQFVFGYNASVTDNWGTTNGGVTVYYSPGDLSGANNNAIFNQARTDGKAAYTYALFTLERVTKLPFGFTWDVRGTAQLANENLLGSEQLGLGGFSTVRGYEEREVNGDQGWIINNEIRTPPVSLTQLFTKCSAAQDSLQFLFFWDYGTISNVVKQPGESANITLTSIGPGVRYKINTYASLRFDYGFQLKDSGVANNNDGSYGHLAFLLSY